MNWEVLLSSSRPGAFSPSSAVRSSFEQDFDRIIFSHPFRRLQDKTQVHPLPEHDFVHTRLTHSLEVSSVARSLGRQVGEVILERNPGLKAAVSQHDFGSVTAAAALAHDLGNPPFGHTGEEALSEFFRSHDAGKSFQAHVTPQQWRDLLHFEGNAQGFRILSRGQYGLKLTAATRGAFVKYPVASVRLEEPGRKSRRKYGFFQTEESDFIRLAEDLGLKESGGSGYLRHPLAFLVEAADDICYSIIDLEDGCRLGLITLDETIELLSGIIGDALDVQRLHRESSLNEKLGVLRGMAISRLTDDCAAHFIDQEQDILSGRFDQALADSGRFQAEMDRISQVSFGRIYRAPHVTQIEAAGFRILPGLLEVFTQAVSARLAGERSKRTDVYFRLLPAEVADDISRGKTVYEQLRAVLDFVSGLTDRHALTMYRKLNGISL